MKYTLNKKIVWINLILCLALTTTIISIEGLSILTHKTEYLECPNETTTPQCEFILTNGTTYHLNKGQTETLNQHNPTNTKIANYGVWLIILTSLTINHIKYNKKYPIKQKIKNTLQQFKTQQ